MKKATPCVISYFTVEHQHARIGSHDTVVQTTVQEQSQRTELPQSQSTTSHRYSISEQQLLVPSNSRLFSAGDEVFMPSISSSTAMREFFDFSAAAKSSLKPSISYSHLTSLDEKSANIPKVKSLRLHESVSIVESVSDEPETLDSLIELAERV
jgi:hypothetical protein